jgi:biopolymer transport protein ExbD
MMKRRTKGLKRRRGKSAGVIEELVLSRREFQLNVLHTSRTGEIVSKAPKAFDVWFVKLNTVYKGVPYSVVAEWTQEGRLAPIDKVRPAKTTLPWTDIGEHELFADYVARPIATGVVQVGAAATVAPPGVAQTIPSSTTADADNVLPEAEELTFRRPAGEEDDDVDMIPLIDVSMVLLVFFIIMRAAGALSPIDVPEMKYAGQLRNDPDAITINIDKQDEFTIFYSVRVGVSPPTPEHDNLETPAKAMEAVDELIAGTQKPSEIRIACRKDLPRERVYEIRRELEKRRKDNKNITYSATVLEAPKPQ